MTRRSRTILTVSVTLPVPTGKTQTELLEEIKKLFNSSDEAVIKLEKKEIIYL